MARLWAIIDRERTLMALAGFACVGLGSATIVPMVFGSAGQMRDFAPGIAVSSVTALGHLGFLLGPPSTGLAVEWFGLRYAFGIIVLTRLVAAALAPSLHQEKTKPAK